MSDDKPSRRHLDFTRMIPGRTAEGECDSDNEAWRNEPTPVRGIRSHRPITEPVEVDPSAFNPDIRWAEFEEMRDEIRACKADRLATARRRRWIMAAVVPSGAGVVSLLVWAVTKLDARADAAAQERLRIEMLNRHEAEIRNLQLQGAATAALLGLRAIAPNP